MEAAEPFAVVGQLIVDSLQAAAPLEFVEPFVVVEILDVGGQMKVVAA